MILADSHTHTNFSPDSNSTVDQVVEQAIKIGLKYLTITDHCDFRYPLPNPEIFLLDKPPYFKAVLDAQTRYQSQIEVLLGVEIGLVNTQVETVADFVKYEPFDFIIGSTHVVHGHDPYYPPYFQTFSEKEGYRRYFQTIPENAIAFDEYDVYGHMDYVVRYGPTKDQNYRPADYQEIFDEGFRQIIADGKGIEINTGGWSRGVNQPHPHPDLIKRYRELGGEIITVGSDAHSPRHVAADFPRAAEILKDAGFKYYAVYKARKPFFLPL